MSLFALAIATAAAVPYYSDAQFVQGLHAHALRPAAQQFAARAVALDAAVVRYCGAVAPLDTARTAWADALRAWERLSALTLGPTLARRSARQIDFQPARPALIERAIAAAPADLSTTGAPAKGLPALEWLLWTRPAPPASPACRHAALVAADIAHKAQAIVQAPDTGDTPQALSDTLNQLVGGIERLRWQRIGKPMHARTPFARAASGQTAAAWQAQWQQMHRLIVMPPAPPAPGSGLVPLELHLRGRGLLAQADRLAQAARAADIAMRGATPEAPARLRAAQGALARLKAIIEGDVASALRVRIGFSDADGD